MANLLAEQMLVLFLVLAIGTWLGQVKVKGVSLGAAGCYLLGSFLVILA